jgi:isopentenyl-diphosphate delta-isomerase type 1
LTEFFWVIDEDDGVIGKATREECHRTNLNIHRSVYIFLFNGKGDMLLQKRSESKDLYGGYYTGSATGHVDYGESYDEAAERELKEELGITADLKRISNVKCFSRIEREISVLYYCQHDGPIRIDEEEISQVVFMSLEQIRKELYEGVKKFALGFKIAFNELLKHYSSINDCVSAIEREEETDHSSP